MILGKGQKQFDDEIQAEKKITELFSRKSWKINQDALKISGTRIYIYIYIYIYMPLKLIYIYIYILYIYIYI